MTWKDVTLVFDNVCYNVSPGILEFTRSMNGELEVDLEGTVNRMTTKPRVNELTIEKVIYNNPATIILWGDGTKTVVRCQPGDQFSPELGFLLAVFKKTCGNSGRFNDLLREYVPGYVKKEDSDE